MLPLLNGPPSSTEALNAFAASATWIQTVLTGSIATAIGVIAIASIGLLMLYGRVELRRGGRVILGCFIVFGSAALAEGLMGAARVDIQTRAQKPPYTTAVISEQTVLAPQPPASDPYAGAAVRR